MDGSKLTLGGIEGCALSVGDALSVGETLWSRLVEVVFVEVWEPPVVVFTACIFRKEACR